MVEARGRAWEGVALTARQSFRHCRRSVGTEGASCALSSGLGAEEQWSLGASPV